MAALSWLLFGAFATWLFLAPTGWGDVPTLDAKLRWFAVCGAGLVCLLPALAPAHWWVGGWRFVLGAGLLVLWAGSGLALWGWVTWAGLRDMIGSGDEAFTWDLPVLILSWLSGSAVLLIGLWLRPAWLVWWRLRRLRQERSGDPPELPLDWEEAPCAATRGE